MSKLVCVNIPFNKFVMIGQYCANFNVKTLNVSGKMSGIKVSDILIGKRDENESLFNDEMLIFDGFSSEALDDFLFFLKQNQLSVQLKACVTKTNLDWTLFELYSQLQKEFEFYSKNKN